MGLHPHAPLKISSNRRCQENRERVSAGDRQTKSSNNNLKTMFFSISKSDKRKKKKRREKHVHQWRSKYSTVGCRRTWGTWSQPRSFLFFKTPANLVLNFQSAFESRWLACSAHTVGDDACRAGNAAEMFQTVELESFHSQRCRRRSRLHSKRCLGVVRLFLQPGVVLIFDEISAWPFFGKPFFGTRQYCTPFRVVSASIASQIQLGVWGAL